MRPVFAAVLALAAGIVLGVFGVTSLMAQKPPKAYAIAEIEVADPGEFMKFAPAGEKTVLEAGGRFLARGEPIGLSGGAPPGRLVVIEFASMDELRKWWNDPDWQEALKSGERHAKFQTMAIEGAPP